MELNIILAVITFVLLSVMGLAIYLIPSTKKNAAATKEPVAEVQGRGGRLDAARNQRARMRANAARQRHDVNPEEENHAVEDNRAEAEDQDASAGDAKLGAKKRAKLEAKAERKAARVADERVREVKKAQDEKDEEERKRLEEIEKAEEMKRAELERKEIEEREKREQEEYLQMKAAFSVEGEGFEDEGENDTGKNLLQEFVHYIRANKVVVIEDLAAHFKLKTQAAIDRISTLQADGILTGVVDDRGKFIYISQEELENVAKFIKQRGRVSITDLVESSNELINLVPVPV